MLILVTGCNAVSDSQTSKNQVVIHDNPDQFFFIEGLGPKQQVTPILQNNQMTMGTLKVSNWPGVKLNCKVCQVSKNRKDYFDGSTVWLNIVGSDQSTLLVTSFQRRDFIDPWHLTYKKDNLIIEDRKAGVRTSIAYDASLPIVIKETVCELVRLKREAQKQVPEGISNDVAAFKTQFVIQCQN
ncbi:hypothetical protein [Bermanella marisrubri]|uniref:hypothetical protein n=1 Tax=Bermanella marisrubri TaxID=207949 RepID=UPI001059BF36|nr:hypothetical protein [Bermanella marisrubri]